MQRKRQSGDQICEEKHNRRTAEDSRIVTDDFVHFVVHFAANAIGNRCDMCTDERPIRYS